MLELVKRYNEDIDWNVGSLFAHDRYIHKLLDYCKELNYDTGIKYVFGSIPCILQGGRIAPRDATLENAFNIMKKYFDRGVSCRLTLSSNMVTEEELSDELSNKLLDFLNSNNDGLDNGIIVSSDLLANYIRDKYQNLKLIASQVKPSVEVGLGEDSVDYYNSLFDLYDTVVVNPFKVNDIKFLKDIKYPDRVEFIANHHCLPNCPMAKSHYEIQIKISKKALKNEDIEEDIKTLNSINDKCIMNRKYYPLAGTFSESDIDMLISLGYKHFKIEGRDNSGDCFVRDVGQYIFNEHLYTRLAHAILEEAM